MKYPLAGLLALTACASATPVVHGTPRFQTAAYAGIPGRITVHVRDIPEPRGVMFVELYDASTYFHYENVLDEETPRVTGKELTVTLMHVPPGRYILVAAHDANENKVLDRGLFGKPTEAYGFSRDARGLFGPPSFEDGAFDFDGTTAELSVRVR